MGRPASIRMLPLLLLLALGSGFQQAAAFVRPWASVEPFVLDTSAWPEVAILLKVRDLDSYGGDSHSYDTSLPNPRNPHDCRVEQPDGTTGCWQIQLRAGGRTLPVLQQRTLLDMEDLRLQYLRLVYRADAHMSATDPLEIDLVTSRYGADLNVLKHGSGHLDLSRTARQPLRDPASDYLMFVAESRWKELLGRLPARQRDAGLALRWERFVTLDCEFQAAVLEEDIHACRYGHIHARLEDERNAAAEDAR